MQKYIDGSTILTEAKMMYHDYHETYILIEGESDKTFFNTLMGKSANIRFRPVKGWERVRNTILLAQKESYAPIAGVIDRDYHSLLQDGVEENEQLFFTDSNDIEMMLFESSSFDKFISVCADENKIKAYEAPRLPVLESASHLGALRALSLFHQYHFHFDGFECKDYINRNSLDPDCTKLVEKITQRTRSKGTLVTVTNDLLKLQIEEFTKQHNVQCLCNGHDVLDILGIAMTKLYASASSSQYNADALFDYLLMGYSVEEFQESRLYKALSDWIKANTDAA